MSHNLLFTCLVSYRHKLAFGAWLVCLLLGLNNGAAFAQNTTFPFTVRVTPAGPLDVCPNTTRTLTATAVYPAFNSGTGFNNNPNDYLYTSAIQPDGKILVGGGFAYYNGIRRGSIARLNADGSLDTSFELIGTGFNGFVTKITLQPDGKILVAGNFTNYNGTGRNYIARLEATGALDTSFAPTGTGLNNPLSANQPPIDDIVVQPDGKVLVGGDFTFYNGISRNRVARLHSDGSLDNGFVIGNGLDSYVDDIALQPDGKVLVAGGFSSYNGTLRNRIARLNPNGSLDANFNPNGTGIDNFVNTMALQPDGKVLVGGGFTNPRVRIARLNADGTVDTGFTPAGAGLGRGGNQNPYVDDIILRPTGKVLIGGGFSSYDGTPRNHIAQLNSDGTLDRSFAPVGTGLNGQVSTVVLQPDGKVVVAGGFTSYNAIDFGRIIRLETDGTLNNIDTPVPNTPSSISYTWSTTPATNSRTLLAGLGTYSVTATQGPFSATSPPVVLQATPPPSLLPGALGSGVARATVTINGNNLGSLRRLLFSSGPNGRCTAAFVLVSPTQLQATVPDSATTGPLTLVSFCGGVSPTNTSFSVLPTIQSFSPQTGTPGTSVTVVGTGFTAGTTVSVGPSSVANISLISSRELRFAVPVAAATGRLVVTTPTGSATSTSDFVVSTGAASDLVVTQSITLGGRSTTYRNITVVKPAVLTVTNFLQVSGQFIVQDGATIDTGTGTVVGTGSFVLADGATLRTSHPAGINSGTAPLGPILVTNGRSFSSDANYIYHGTGNQITGTGLPSRVRNLTVGDTPSSSLTLTLTGSTSFAQKLTVANNCVFDVPTSQTLTLLSTAAGTALVHNVGTGTVTGQVTVQRYVSPATNSANGFRYCGSPVQNANASVLAVGPTPTVLDYDQSRQATQYDGVPLITYGFDTIAVSALPTTPLTPGRGYAAAIPAATRLDFVGPLNNGPIQQTLSNNSLEYYAGWHLVSNPYPSPIDWDLVAPADRVGLEAAIYIFESTGPGRGYFRSYVRGAGTASRYIAAGQAFFVRVRRTIPFGTLTFRNEHRVTEYNTQVVFNRSSQDDFAGFVQISGGNGGSGSGCGRQCRTSSTAFDGLFGADYSSVIVYEQPGVKGGFNPEYDARAGDLQARKEFSLSLTDSLGQALSIKAFYRLTATTVFPLVLTAVAPGDNYRIGISTAQRDSLPAGLTPYLRDKKHNRWIPLRDSIYTFTLTSEEILNPVAGRFELHFSRPVVASNQAWSKAGDVSVYPNPAHQQVSVWVPAVPGAQQVQLALRNALGQVVRQQTGALPAAGTTLQLNLSNLVPGVYILRLQAGTATVTRRLLVE